MAKLSLPAASEEFRKKTGRVIKAGAASIPTLLKYHHHSVTAKRLRRVGQLVESGKIQVAFTEASCCGSEAGFVTKQKGGLLALQKRGKMPLVRYHALMLHEATHLTWRMFDHSVRIKTLDDEALAFVVEAFYCHKHGVDDGDVTDPMLKLAFAAMRQVKAAKKADKEHMEDLRNELVLNGYEDGMLVYKPLPG